MAHILAHDHARELPLYIDGFHAGHDVGLMVALNAIVAEMVRQNDAAIVAAVDPRQHVETARHQYCAGRLLAVGRIVAERFRQ
jgi:hypothetical protein